MRLRALLVIMLFGGLAFGQGGHVDLPAVFSQSSSPMPIPGLTVTVCAIGATGTPCSPSVSVFSDQALTPPGIANLQTNGDGLAPFFISPGSYQRCLSDTLGRITAFCAPFTVAPPGGGVASFTSIANLAYVCPIIDNTGLTAVDGIANACIVSANSLGEELHFGQGNFKLNNALNFTNLTSLNTVGAGSAFAGSTSTKQTIFNCNTGGVCIDTTGSSNMSFKDFTPRIANTYSNPSTVAILEGRDNAAGGGTGAFCFSQGNNYENVNPWTDFNNIANSGKGFIGFYNIGGEHRIYRKLKAFATTPMLFATTNVLSVASPYQTLQTGCPNSMTIVHFDDVSLTNNGGHGIEAYTTAEFSGTIEVDFTAADSGLNLDAIAFFSAYTINWDIQLHIENMVANNNIFSIGSTVFDKNKLSSFVGGSTGAGAYIAFSGSGATITGNTFAFDTQNEVTPRQFVSNAAANTIKGGVLQIGTTANPQSASNITVTGALVQAEGFTHSQVAFNSASQFDFLGDDGKWTFGANGFTAATTWNNAADSTLANNVRCGSTSDQACQFNFLDKSAATQGVLQKDASNNISLSKGTSKFLLTSGQTSIEDTTAAGITINDSASTTGLFRLFSGSASSVEVIRQSGNGFQFFGVTQPAGVASRAVCRYDSATLQALKCNYNAGTEFAMAQVIPATSAAFATATTAGTCVQSTTAVTGATTAMTVQVSPVSTPGVGAQWSGFVSSAGNVTINECAVAASAGGTIAFNIRVTP